MAKKAKKTAAELKARIKEIDKELAATCTQRYQNDGTDYWSHDLLTELKDLAKILPRVARGTVLALEAGEVAQACSLAYTLLIALEKKVDKLHAATDRQELKLQKEYDSLVSQLASLETPESEQ